MLLHHTDLYEIVARAALRLDKEGKPNDQLLALLVQIEAIAEQAEAKDAEIKRILEALEGKLPRPERT